MRPQRNTYVYTAYTQNYQFSTIVVAPSLKQARITGYREAKLVMGNHARIARDDVREEKNK